MLRGRVLAVRLLPNEDLVAATEAVAHAHGITRALVRGGPGSLLRARLTAGGAPFDFTGPAIEVLALSGEIGPAGAVLDGMVSDGEGDVRAGRFVRGANPVCITVEMSLEELLT